MGLLGLLLNDLWPGFRKLLGPSGNLFGPTSYKIFLPKKCIGFGASACQCALERLPYSGAPLTFDACRDAMAVLRRGHGNKIDVAAKTLNV
jgi:hypothetical protein